MSLLVAAAVFGQGVQTGTLAGTVTGPDGAGLPGVTVTVSSPALMGERGCVREMVRIAHENGFYWGGHFTRLDGMHFEVAKLQ